MHIGKRLGVLLLALLFIVSTPGLARADVLVEPRDDFYEKHRDTCVYQSRQYLANGAEGYATLWKSPASSTQTENVANGEILNVDFVYTAADGTKWGGVWGAEAEELRGWVRLDDCLVLPDYIAFAEAYAEAFVDFDPAYADALADVETVALWKYPGSGMLVSEVEAEWFHDDMSGAGYVFDRCYVDADGRFWGFCQYCYGIKNTWICLSDPANTTLAADAAILPLNGELILAAAHIPAPGAGIPMLAVILVVALAAVTALLIWLLFRKKKQG